MFKRLSGLILFGCLLIWGATLTSAQCGSYVQTVIMNCGIHCGSIAIPTCQGDGSFCEDNTGDPGGGGGCCGFQFINPGECQLAKAAPFRALPPTKEFLALQDAVALHKRLFRPEDNVTIASCAPDRNAFNNWLQAKLRQQQQR